MNKLNFTTLISVVLRSFLIQAQFTFNEKLGTGFGFSLIPGLRRIHTESGSRKAALKRHTEYFNTHPYLASYLLGICLRLEEDGAPEGKIRNMKERLAGILGSLGDRLFWKYLKPAASVLCLIFILGYSDFSVLKTASAITVFLLLFNSFHLYFRTSGVFRGYRNGLSVMKSGEIKRIEKFNSRIQQLTLLMLGMLFFVELNMFSRQDILSVAVFLLAVLISIIFNYRKLPPGLGILIGLFTSGILVFSANTLYGF